MVRRVHREDRERGAVVVIISMLGLVLLGMTAMVVDIGTAAQEKRWAQSITDSAALAAAQDLPTTATARDTALAYAKDNARVSATSSMTCAAGTACYSGEGWTITVTSPYLPAGAVGTSSDYVRVVACRRSPTTFGSALSVYSVEVCGKSTARRAMNVSPYATPCALCVLSATGTSLNATGSGALRVNNGSIIVNSSDAQAVKVTNNTSIVAAPAPPVVIGINGGYNAGATQLTPTPSTGFATIPDPLASLTVPTATTNYGAVSITGSQNLSLQPGIYSNISSSSDGQITLAAGVYVITGQLKLTKPGAAGKFSLKGDGVTLYFACSNYPSPCASGGSSGGSMQLTGGTVSLTAPSNGSWQGIAIMADRNNTAEHKLTGSSSSTLNGTIYAKSGTVSLVGSSDTGVDAGFTSAVVANMVTKSGNSGMTLSYDVNRNTPLLAATAAVGLTE